MRRLAVLALAFAGTPLIRADDAKDELKLTADEQGVIDRTNAERKEKELPPLKANPKLMTAARAHAGNMAKQSKLDHTLDEKGPPERAKDAGYPSKFVGENIAWNQKGPKEALAAWMDSEGHRNNILSKDYTEIGVAVAKNAKGEPYWVQVFGKQ